MIVDCYIDKISKAHKKPERVGKPQSHWSWLGCVSDRFHMFLKWVTKFDGILTPRLVIWAYSIIQLRTVIWSNWLKRKGAIKSCDGDVQRIENGLVKQRHANDEALYRGMSSNQACPPPIRILNELKKERKWFLKDRKENVKEKERVIV